MRKAGLFIFYALMHLSLYAESLSPDHPSEDSSMVLFLLCSVGTLILLLLLTSLKVRKYKKKDAVITKYVELLKVEKAELEHFIYKSTHDLKGPITRIVGLAFLLKQDQESQVDYIDKIEVAANDLNDILGRLIMTRRIARHEAKFKKLTIGEIKKSVEAHCEKHEVDLNWESALSNLTLDAHLFNIAISNLVDNADKFRLPTEKAICYVKISSITDQYKLEFTDTGMGIAADVQDRIFDMFFVGNERVKGMGLGLYEARLAMERMKGSIELSESEPGKTTFLIKWKKID